MNAQTTRFFAEKDNRPPPGVNKMAVRTRMKRSFGPYQLVLESSCGVADEGTTQRRTTGGARLSLFDMRSDDPEQPVAVKRWQVDSWRDCQQELKRAESALVAK